MIKQISEEGKKLQEELILLNQLKDNFNRANIGVEINIF